MEWPKYLVNVNGKLEFVPIRRAGALMNSGWSRVEVKDDVLMPDFSLRQITKEETREINRIADEISDSK